MKILVIQHAEIEHPGIFRRFLEEDGHQWFPVYINQGDKLPEIDKFDALWVMGGPMDTWEEDKYPWLVKEKEYIKNAVVNIGIPYLGLCLGHQLLAEALGTKCGPSKKSEVGVLNVNLTDEGARGVILDGFPDTFKCLQWHGAEVKKLPEGCKILAYSEHCQIQAMSWGLRAYSFQFHVEVEKNTVKDWLSLDEYSLALKRAKGENGAKLLEEECKNEMVNFNKLAERLYINWLQTSSRA